MIEFNDLLLRLKSLTVFRGMLRCEALKTLDNLLSLNWSKGEKLSKYAQFVHTLEECGGSLSDTLKKHLCADENMLITCASQGKEIPQSVKNNAKRELETFSLLTQLTQKDFERYIGCDVPEFENEKTDMAAFYEYRVKNVSRLGYGIFALSGMFRVEDDIVPIDSADSIAVDSFIGYDTERQKVIDNTRALAQGRPAANTLLFGDAGTGKSSTVKACANMFFDDGVRLIELRKDQLLKLPYVMGRIMNNPLKFIIFIDDLSFNKNDDSFGMLKAALEGSASAKADNAVIYATSNRRHIVKESLSDREGDDIHRNDTMQELMSLSDRFGLTVYFEKPNKKLYLDIVHALAQRCGVDTEDMDIRAEAFALSRGSRSPRTAEQFVKSLLK